MVNWKLHWLTLALSQPIDVYAEWVDDFPRIQAMTDAQRAQSSRLDEAEEDEEDDF